MLIEVKIEVETKNAGPVADISDTDLVMLVQGIVEESLDKLGNLPWVLSATVIS